MLEQAVERIFAKLLETKFPHLSRPAAAYARVTSAKELGADSRCYSLKLLKADMTTDSLAAEIPNVKSKLLVDSGAVVAVVNIGGRTEPFIVGEVVL